MTSAKVWLLIYLAMLVVILVTLAKFAGGSAVFFGFFTFVIGAGVMARLMSIMDGEP